MKIIYLVIDRMKEGVQNMTKTYCYAFLSIPMCATKDQINKAFRKKAVEYHPDNNNGNDEMFKKLVEVRRFLTDINDISVKDQHNYYSVKYKKQSHNKTKQSNEARLRLRRIIKSQIRETISTLHDCELVGLTINTLDGKEIGTIIDERKDKDNPSLSFKKIKIDFKNGERKNWHRFDLIVEQYIVGFTDTYNQEVAEKITKLRMELVSTFGLHF